MKKTEDKFLLPTLTVVVGVIVLFISGIYLNIMSRQIYEDSTANLEEVYSQVNRSFSGFLNRNWGLLENWEKYLSLTEEEEEAAAYLAEEQQRWGFSTFYFLNRDGTCMQTDGTERNMDLGDAFSALMGERESVMAGERLATGDEIIIFAVPVETGRYRDFSYDAIAISYTNADMANSLNVGAFGGKARCFVVRSDGSVLLSTQAGGNVFENYLTYLQAASNLDEQALLDIQSDWADGVSGLLRCDIADVEYCVLYQPVGYQDYFLLSAVPISALSAGFLSVQRSTVYVLIAIFLLIGAAVVAVLIHRNRRLSRMSSMELTSRDMMFDALSNNVDDIFLMLDAEQQRADYISPNIQRLMGIPLKDAKEDLRAVQRCAIQGGDIIPKRELEEIPLGSSIYRECEYMHQETGERRWYRLNIYHVGIREIEKYIIIMSDRTQERQMNQQLEEALAAARSANEAKSNFLSNVSHDIRTPMNAIVGFSVLLEKDSDNPEKVREYTQKIKSSSQHLLSLINDVLDMSKIESGKTSLNVDNFSLPEVMEELTAILLPQAKAKHQSFEIYVQGSPPENLIGDKLRLNQILINLLSNAIKYTPEGGDIWFLVKELPQTQPQFVKLRFVVKDNGIGMSPDYLEHIFQPFSREINSVTNKIQGTGLGMAITKNLVDLMGGVIQVESAPGEGSTFTLDLSFALSGKESAEQELTKNISRILVTDDEEEICLGIQEVLQRIGIQVDFATDGESAVLMAVDANSRGKDYDVILLDWKMPGQDGVHTARRIRRKIGDHVPILVLTSYDWEEIEDEARAAGINAFLPKPFFVSSFWRAIRPFLDQRGAQSTPSGQATFPEDRSDSADVTSSAKAGGAGTAPLGNVPHTDEDFERDENALAKGQSQIEIQKHQEAEENPLEGKLFLVAEDNELNAEILTEMLAMEGASCELAENGKEAVELFEQSDPGHYDVILMDVQMPVMNGYEATRAIRTSAHPEATTIPIVAMTANTFAEDVRNSQEAGMNGHLAKPIDMDAVRLLLSRLMRKRKE